MIPTSIKIAGVAVEKKNFELNAELEVSARGWRDDESSTPAYQNEQKGG